MAGLVIGVPKEIKDNENRVSMQPDGVAELVHHGNAVLVQAGAGDGSRFPDEEFAAAGAVVVPSADAVFASKSLVSLVSLIPTAIASATRYPLFMASMRALTRSLTTYRSIFHIASSVSKSSASTVRCRYCNAYWIWQYCKKGMMMPWMSLRQSYAWTQQARNRCFRAPGLPDGRVTLSEGRNSCTKLFRRADKTKTLAMPSMKLTHIIEKRPTPD